MKSWKNDLQMFNAKRMNAEDRLGLFLSIFRSREDLDNDKYFISYDAEN